MILNVVELGNGEDCRQKFTVGDRPITVYGFRIHLVRYLSPAGVIQLQLQDANGNKIASSTAVTAANISHTGPVGNYWHGYYLFSFNPSLPGLKANTSYWLELTSSGYT